MITEQLAKYYALSAATQDQAYDREERQDDLDELHDAVAEVLHGHKVLEIACGTGYWTEALAPEVLSLHATDINPDMLALAQERDLVPGKVTFGVADAYDLPADVGTYTACFAGFWWSHVKREDQQRFLAQLTAKLGKNTMLVLLDESYVDGSSDVVARTDLEGNTYQIHTVPNGDRYEVVKNFPSDSTLRKKLANAVREIRILRLEHYWMLTCRLK